MQTQRVRPDYALGVNSPWLHLNSSAGRDNSSSQQDEMDAAQMQSRDCQYALLSSGDNERTRYSLFHVSYRWIRPATPGQRCVCDVQDPRG